MAGSHTGPAWPQGHSEVDSWGPTSGILNEFWSLDFCNKKSSLPCPSSCSTGNLLFSVSWFSLCALQPLALPGLSSLHGALAASHSLPLSSWWSHPTRLSSCPQPCEAFSGFPRMRRIASSFLHVPRAVCTDPSGHPLNSAHLLQGDLSPLAGSSLKGKAPAPAARILACQPHPVLGPE